MNFNLNICFTGLLSYSFLCKGSIKTILFCCHSAEETDKVLLMPSKNVLCSKVWLLKMSSDFNELLEGFVPRETRK